MFANDPVTPDPPPAVQISALFWISVAAFVGVGAGAVLFGNGFEKADITQRSQALGREADASPPVLRHSRLIMEAQIARKSSKQLRRDGFHRFAVLNAGSKALRMEAVSVGNPLRLEVQPEVPPGDFGYVLVHWGALDAEWKTPYRRIAHVYTDDPENAEIHFVIAEEIDVPE